MTARSRQESGTAASPRRAGAGATRPNILVVDDEEDLCRLLTLRLEHHGFRVSTEQTARGAVEVLEREVVDAMIVDIRLGQENGLDLLSEVQNRSVDLPVVILTAHGGIETAVEALRRGAYGFLTKPFEDLELLQKLEHAVESVRLRREIAGLRRFVDGSGPANDRILGTSDAIADVRERIARVAPTDASVLLLGESGTGKEVAARFLWAQSGRAAGPFVAINCGALPADLLESELFGHTRGAFTGADRNKDGLFRAAHGGTLFLDEIGDAPPQVQVKLLRVLQERSFLPVGGTEPTSVDVRIVAATNRDLQAEVTSGRFREDLFYRLHVMPIAMPALRDRIEDVPSLAEVFLARARAKHGFGAANISSEVVELLMRHPWPGNVRELANVMEGAALLVTDGVLRREHIRAVMPWRDNDEVSDTERPAVSSDPVDSTTVIGDDEPFPRMRQAREAFDRAYLQEALRRARGNVSAAAKLAGRNRTDFHDLLRRHGIDASRFRP